MQKRELRFPEAMRRLVRDESGTTAIEYTIIASVVSIAILAAAQGVGTALHDNFYDKAAKAFE
jgi:pilus assembly protein Flp/PilA